MLIKHTGAAQSSRVCVHMYKKEDPERNDAGHLVQFAQKESSAKTYRHFDNKIYPIFDGSV